MALIRKVKFIDCEKLQDCRYAPLAGEVAFIVNNEYVIADGECEEFDCDYYSEIFEDLEEFD